MFFVFCIHSRPLLHLSYYVHPSCIWCLSFFEPMTSSHEACAPPLCYNCLAAWGKASSICYNCCPAKEQTILLIFIYQIRSRQGSGFQTLLASGFWTLRNLDSWFTVFIPFWLWMTNWVHNCNNNFLSSATLRRISRTLGKSDLWWWYQRETGTDSTRLLPLVIL